MSWRPALFVVYSLALAACATTTPDMDPELLPGMGGRDVLFAADLVRAHSPNLYDAIVEVRPDFFDRKTAVDLDGRAKRLRVFVNGVDLGDLEALHTVPLGPVVSVRYVRSTDAEFHWTHGVDGAAILVTTAR